MRYTVILEKGDSSFGAYVPDLPGCVAAGQTKEEALELIAEAISSGESNPYQVSIGPWSDGESCTIALARQ